MLMLPPPGFDTTAVNQQSNQLLGKPGMPGTGHPIPAGSKTVGSPAMKAPFNMTQQSMSPNPLQNSNMNPIMRIITQLLGAKH